MEGDHSDARIGDLGPRGLRRGSATRRQVSRRSVVAVFVAAVSIIGPAVPATASAATDLPDPVPCPGCWQAPPVTSWQWQLSSTVDTGVDVQMYGIDGFDNPASLVATLHGDGRRVVCYISAGSVEKWRPDAGRFPERIIGKRLEGWAGERWLDVRRRGVLRDIMQQRVQMCADKGFDAVEFDNVDGWSNRTGFPLRGSDQLRYNVMLANLAHAAGLSAFLKNDVEQIRRLLPYFDMALNEECFSYDECDLLLPFLDAGKAVFHVEYELDTADFCPQANAMNMNSLKKRWSLGVWRVACR